MCGIAGYLIPKGKQVPHPGLIRSLNACMSHRGPDDEGSWYDEAAGVGFAHTRLSILDLSSMGHQPMLSASGRLVVTFNGEIYNYRELRVRLEGLGHRFKSNTDTEVLLAAVEEWGLERALEHFIGMFAFALWDRKQERLHLVRDRLGVKPLYYGSIDRALVFGSELLPLRRFAGRPLEVDRGALGLYLRHGYVPSPYSIYRDVEKLRPGQILTARRDSDGTVSTSRRTYWSLLSVTEAGPRDPLLVDSEGAADALEDAIFRAVEARTVADVPLGALLSGGVDSSLVVAALQAVTSRPVRTFSIGFHEQSYDEAPHARSVAEHLGTDHRELYVTPETAQAVIPTLPRIYDEPFADPSQIPTLLVCQLAREDVKVSLTGDGGDESFGGYDRYFQARLLWRGVGWLPAAIRERLGRLVRAVPSRAWDLGFGPLRPLLPEKYRHTSIGARIQKIGEVLGHRRAGDLYRSLHSHWTDAGKVVLQSECPVFPLESEAKETDLASLTEFMMYLDSVTYLPDDVLTKLDRASMAVSLEARVPLLDHRVVELAWRLPLREKVRGREGKRILRKVLHRHVPPELVERPKMGFGVPIDSWLRGPLKGWAERLLAEDRLCDEGFFRPEPIRRAWRIHQSGSSDRHYLLWDVLMFQAWLEAQA